MLEICDIHTYYGKSHILHGVNLSIREGTLGALLGRNGMGKTTTIRSIIGFNPPRTGKILFRGQEIQGMASYRISQLGLGLVPQGRGIFPNLTVLENLLIAARPGNGMGWNLTRVYELFPRLQERANHSAGKLSGGEAQMLSICRALMLNPDMILLDEPSEGLAPLVVNEVAEKLVELKKMGVSILLVEQNINMALKIADSVFVLNKGQVVFSGTPKELVDNTEVQSQYLGVGH
ncbi:MAG: ABC transporter ATP-binding protein [Clostridia bacterium]|nr:ABC transporter ATP-binding protein [Clostridia bacterium]